MHLEDQIVCVHPFWLEKLEQWFEEMQHDSAKLSLSTEILLKFTPGLRYAIRSEMLGGLYLTPHDRSIG